MQKDAIAEGKVYEPIVLAGFKSHWRPAMANFTSPMFEPDSPTIPRISATKVTSMEAPPNPAAPNITTFSAPETAVINIVEHPRWKRASAGFWVLLVAILAIGFGILAFGSVGGFGGY
jgi:hypothetical protein